MSDLPPDPPPVDPVEAEAPAPKARPRRRLRISWKGPLIALAVLLIGLPLLITQGVRTDPGRALATRILNTISIGRFGKLKVEGLQGDLFHDFSVRRVAIVDPKGEWLEIRDLGVVWNVGELLARRFHAEQIRAGALRVLRQPQLRAPGPPGGKNPLGVVIDDIKLSLETLPEFSSRRGLWDVSGQFSLDRAGPAVGRLDARSRLHEGDGLVAVFRFGDGRILLRADAVEGKGGALAGAAGLPADNPFYLQARVDGTNGAGKLTVSSRSGSLVPVRAEGTWTKDGASMSGLVVLEASRLTAGYAARVGPEVRFRLGARKGQGELFDIDAELVAKDAQVYAKGPVDWRKRTSPGLQLSAAVTDLRRWVHVPAIGATRAAGIFTGDLSRFVYKGRVEGEKLTQNDYELAHLSGPATLTKTPGVWRVQADLKGAGGKGSGLFGALLGAQPTAVLDGSRLADGRFFFKQMKVVGAGLQLDAEGGQDLLRGLTFKGVARFSNLAAARKGAGGVLQADWSARQARGSPVWGISFDAQGQTFATGMAELDRILGGAPRLAAAGEWGPTGLEVTRAELTGAQGRAGAKGRLGKDQTLGFDLDWSARGPFAAGPVEVAGAMSGAGRLMGTLSEPTVDLAADLASLDVGRLVLTPARLTLLFSRTATGSDGRIGVSGDSAWGKATASSAFRFVDGGVQLTDVAADAGGVKASGQLALTGGAPSSADLKIAAGKGAFLSAGQLTGTLRLTDRAGGAQASIALDGKGLAVPEFKGIIDTLRLRADGPWEKLPYTLAVQSAAPWTVRFAGNGVLTQAQAERQITVAGAGRFRRTEFKTTEPALLKFGAGGRSARLRLDVAGGRADIDADLMEGAAQIKAKLAALPMSALNQDFAGRLNADVALGGRGQNLSGTFNANVEEARNRDAPESLALAGFVKGRLDGGVVHIDAGATNSQGLRSSLSVNLPAEASAAPFRLALVPNRPVKGEFAVEGELRPLWELFAGTDRTLSGRVVAKGDIGGALAKLQSRGSAELTNGQLKDVGTGLNLQDLEIHAEFGDNAMVVREFKGGDGRGGILSGDGRMSLSPDGASTLTINLKNFQMVQNSLARAVVSGAVTVTRDERGQAKLSGSLGVDRADITAKPPVPRGVVAMDVVEINKPAREEEDMPARIGGVPVNLDVAIKAPRGVFLKGSGLNVEMSLDAHVSGSLALPLLTGTARMVRGDYDFAGKRFDFDDRSVIRLGSTAEAIRLDLTATREDPGTTTVSRAASATSTNVVRSGGITAVVRVLGTAAKPQITLSSVPVLPQDEVLSQVLFGHSASQLSSLEAAQLASALTSLATGGGFDIVGGLRQFARLDRLAFGGGTDGMAVSGGKYLTNDIYLELTGGGREGPSAQVEWRVRRNLSVVSTVRDRGDARLSVRFRKNY